MRLTTSLSLTAIAVGQPHARASREHPYTPAMSLAFFDPELEEGYKRWGRAKSYRGAVPGRSAMPRPPCSLPARLVCQVCLTAPACMSACPATESHSANARGRYHAEQNTGGDYKFCGMGTCIWTLTFFRIPAAASWHHRALVVAAVVSTASPVS